MAVSTEEIQNSLFKTLETFKVAAENNTKAARILECSINEVLNSKTKKYRVSYLENTFTAHSVAGMDYSVGDKVYVLIPDNDFAKEKIIISTIKASKPTSKINLDFDEFGVGTLII